jgi:3-phosphoshikimate 1-carboxyvinyltransferase
MSPEMSPDETVLIRPARSISGSVRLPGDKSISHRYAMLGAIAEGTTRLENFSPGADCASTMACLRTLGVDSERDHTTIIIRGRSLALTRPTSVLDCGNSGSTMRMLSGILAGQDFTSVLVGDESLSRRPMARIIIPLQAMGAVVSADPGDRPPLRIRGGRLRAIRYELPIPSAQLKTALLFAGLFAEGETFVSESVPTRDHTELALRAFGAEVKREDRTLRIQGGQKLHGIATRIPGDLSSAAFFLGAAGLFPNSQLIIHDLLLNPTRTRLLDLLILMGVRISVTQIQEQHGELRGTVQVRSDELKGLRIAGADTAALIDEIPVLAAIAPYTSNGLEVRDAGELRTKESDRLAAIAANLHAMGAQMEEFEDGLKIPGGQKLHGADIDSFGDHRIAMAFAIAALRAKGDTTIRGAKAAVISYPAFFKVLETLLQR